MFGLFKGIINGRKNTYVLRETQEKILRDWNKINELVELGGPSQLRQALITADRSLDTALRDVMHGETMGERLKNANNRFEKIQYNKIWQAHKMRNMLVHEADYDPPHFMVIENVGILKEALKKLGVKI
jgi:hypothetical protein